MGSVGRFARKTWELFTASNAAAPYRFAAGQSSYTPLDDLWREMFLGAGGAVTREQLLSVPAALRARDMICNIATLPLTEVDRSNRATGNPLYEQWDPQVPNVVHLTQTIEDLWVEGISWWEIVAWDGADFPLAVRRRDPNNVSLNPPAGTKRGRDPLPGGYDPREGVVYVDGREVPAKRMIRFDSPKQSARKVMGKTLRRALALDSAAEMYANDPRPADYFTPKPGMPDPAGDGEIQKILNDWRRWRRQHSTGYVPYALDYNAVDVPTPAELQLVDLQERVTIELAVAFGLEPSDVGAPVTSMTYANVVDKRRDRINDLLSFFMRAITDRLAMPDVSRPGARPLFDLDDYLRPDPKTRWEIYDIASSLGVIGPDWIAREESLPPEARVGAQRDSPAVTEGGGGGRVVPLRAAAGDPRATFDSAEEFAGPVSRERFAADTGRRLLEGIALPYGPRAIAKKGGRRYRFAAGGGWWTEVGRVKLLEDHNHALAFGRALDLTETPDGLFIRARVSGGEHGDRMLSLAADRVKDGFSVGVDWEDSDIGPDPLNAGVLLVHRYQIVEVSQTAMPSFDDARVTRVAASRDQEGNAMPCSICGLVHPEGQAACTPAPPTTTPPATGQTFTAEQVFAMFPAFAAALQNAPAGTPVGIAPAPPARPTVNPEGAGEGNTPAGTVTFVREPLPYKFAGSTVPGEVQFSPTGEHNFHADLLEMSRMHDDGSDGGRSPAGKRVMGLLRRTMTFDIDTADVNELNPNIQRPDMYVDQRDYRRPIWDLVGRGAPPNGVQPFTFPKFSSSSGLVGDHTEGTEPTSGTLVTTNQTVTPSALSGKASLTREVWDMGGNPATASLVFNQMRRGYWEGLESAAATFLNTLTAAADINLGVAPTDAALITAWEGAVMDLQFIRGYDISAFVVEKALYKKFGSAKYSSGEPAFPMIGPSNRNGTAAVRFQTLNLDGIEGIPSWALTSTADAANNSWLFDPSVVFGWATPPQRLEFPGTDSTGGYAPIAMIDLGIWGYKAFANSDIAGVRQVIYDATA